MPNAKVLEEKKAIVEELSEKLKNSSSGVLVDYKGINVADDTKLRKEMREAGVEYVVYKNSLIRFAAQKADLGELDAVLSGTTALAISADDLVAPAKIISEFAKKLKDKFEIKAGFVEGKVISAKEVQDLAELPPKEVLIATVLAGFNAPISGFVNVLNGNLRGLAVALNAIKEKKEEEAA